MIRRGTYDYVIVGGGPCGLTLCWMLGSIGREILLIDSNDELGGCHRVTRVDGLFTEHAPRIYAGSSKTFQSLLKKMNLDFDELFTPYDFDMKEILKEILLTFSLREIFLFSLALCTFLLNPSYGKNITLKSFLTENNFSQSSLDLIDRLARMTEGIGIDTYTLYEFLEIFNQNSLYPIYQPRKPNDIALFKKWEDILILMPNIHILKSHTLRDIIPDEDNPHKINNLLIQNNLTHNIINIFGQKYLCAIPPKALNQIILNKPISNAFGSKVIINEFINISSYLPFVAVVFHWDKKIIIPKIWGRPKSYWGITFIVLSDYMDFDDARSKTVISTCITYPERIPLYISQEELINEVFDQLIQSVGTNLEDPTYSILSPKTFMEKDGKLDVTDSAFVLSKMGFINSKSVIYDNLYWVGSHNGKSFCGFTSIESAVSNAVSMGHELEPDTEELINVFVFPTIRTVFLIMILILLILIKKYL